MLSAIRNVAMRNAPLYFLARFGECRCLGRGACLAMPATWSNAGAMRDPRPRQNLGCPLSLGAGRKKHGHAGVSCKHLVSTFSFKTTCFPALGCVIDVKARQYIYDTTASVSTDRVDSNPRSALSVRAVLRTAEVLARRQAVVTRFDERLSAALSAAKAAWSGMIEGNKRDGENYKKALAEVVAVVQERRFVEGEVTERDGSFTLTIEREGMLRLDRQQQLRLAANVQTSDLGPRTTEEGAGVPFTFCDDRGSPFLRNQPGVSRFGISVPVTAFLSFDGTEKRLSF